MKRNTPSDKRLPHEIFRMIQVRRSVAERVKVLEEHDSFSLRTIIQANFNDSIAFTLPEGEPPYRKDDAPAGYEMARFSNAIKPLPMLVTSNKTYTIEKKESLFIRILEGISGSDAEILIAVKDKKLEEMFPNLTKELVTKVWPTICDPL